MTGTLTRTPAIGLSLPGVYIVWLLALVLLYPICRWFARAEGEWQGMVVELSMTRISSVPQFTMELAESRWRMRMGMMIVRHKVRDYGQWRPIFDQHAEMQRTAGLINPRVYHSADSNKSEIVVVFDTEDTKKAKEFAASADLKEAMMTAGVIDTPTIYFLESID